jgi:hypothetical protein
MINCPQQHNRTVGCPAALRTVSRTQRSRRRFHTSASRPYEAPLLLVHTAHEAPKVEMPEVANATVTHTAFTPTSFKFKTPCGMEGEFRVLIPLP